MSTILDILWEVAAYAAARLMVEYPDKLSWLPSLVLRAAEEAGHGIYALGGCGLG